MVFDWDLRKASANIRKHGVSFQEAASIFGDPLSITFTDPDHSNNECRFITFGLSLQKRMLVISHKDGENSTRIISARLMTRKERKIYEKG